MRAWRVLSTERTIFGHSTYKQDTDLLAAWATKALAWRGFSGHQ